MKARGVSQKNRPAKPKKNSNYPTIPEIALQLLKAFHTLFPEVVIHYVLADNLYGTDVFLEQASAIFGGVQVISKLKKSQNLRFQGKTMKLTSWLFRYPGVKQRIRIRGGEDMTVWVSSARVHVCAHEKNDLWSP